MVDIVQGGGRVHPPPSAGWADFPIMTECTPESGYCHSLYPVAEAKFVRYKLQRGAYLHT